MLLGLGTFTFRHRNWMFPVLVGGFFLLAVPPADLFGSRSLEHLKDAAAILCALAGLTLRALVIGYGHVRRAGQGRAIHADALFTGGMFSLCRNPLYAGNILSFLGLFLMHGNPVTLVFGFSSYVLIYAAIVAAEEKYLLGRFGQPYADYCVRVPRWSPNLLKLPAAVRSMPFNTRRVLLVEYPNMGINVIALALAEFYEQIEQPVFHDRLGYLMFLAALILAAGLWVATVRFAKKRRLIVAD